MAAAASRRVTEGGVRHETTRTEIGGLPEIARLAHEVATSGTRRVLVENGVALAVVTPARPPRRRRRAKPLDKTDSLWNIVGIIKDDVPADVSADKYKYLTGADQPDQP